MNRHHSLLRSSIFTLSLLVASAAAADDAKPAKAGSSEKADKPAKSEKGGEKDPSSTINGKYKYVGAKSEKEIIKKQVDEIVWKADESIRQMAQETLNKRTHVPEWFDIKQKGPKVEIHAEGRTTEKHDLSKESTDGMDQDGNPCALKIHKDPNTLTQWIVTTDGTRINKFTPQPDGSLRVDVEIQSPRLPKPIVYTLTYKK